MKNLPLRSVLFPVIIFLLGACTAKAQSSISPDLSKAFKDAGLNLFKEGVSIRDFTLTTLDGESATLSQFKGKVVFLNFWATWCGPCRIEMPSMESLYNQYKDKGFEILAVNSGESRQQVEDFMKENSFSFPALLDESGKVSSSYGIQAIPTTFLLNSEGKIVLRLVGSIRWDTPKVYAAIETLLNL